MKGVTLISHPIVQHHLTVLRDSRTSPGEFRRLMSEVGTLMAYEATRSLPSRPCRVKSPMGPTIGKELARPVVLVPILRAGLGLLDGFLRLVPEATVGIIGLKRDEKTLCPVGYYQSLPEDLSGAEVIVLDPMLATGGSTSAAVDLLKAKGAKRIRSVHLLAAPEGIRRLRSDHPRVSIFTASIDRTLNSRGYILPGLGDAGDRLFGT